MDGKGICCQYRSGSEEKNESFYPMYFGVSCAFFAIRVLSRPEIKDERWSELCDKMLQGSTQLLGLLVWRIQKQGAETGNIELLHKLETAEKEVERLKKIRREDAKANEKVVGIFASQEQRWLMERKKLRQHIGALMNELNFLEKKKEAAVSEMNDRLKEMEHLLESKDKALQEEEHNREKVEEKLTKTEKVVAELTETAKREAQEHSNDLWKHKTAFLELVSNQRQLEAEMGRAFRQLEAKRKELDSVLQQKEESVLLSQKLSVEVVKMHKDLDQKDKILSAMLRKSKLDTAEKQMLLKEVKLSKAKRKQAELETERWRTVTESRHERHSLRSMFASQPNWPSDDPSLASGTSQGGKVRPQSVDSVLQYENPEFGNDSEVFSPLSGRHSLDKNGALAITTGVKQLEGWVRLEAEKYAASIEKRHHLEIDAFTEQMRLKDEKLEALRWQMLRMDTESKRLQSHVEGLNQDLAQLRNENMKLEALLSERQEELHAMKEQFSGQIHPQACQSSGMSSSLHNLSVADEPFWSKEEIIKGKPIERDPVTETTMMETSQAKDAEEEREASDDQVKNVSVIVQSPEKEFEEGNDIPENSPVQEECVRPIESTANENVASPSQPLMRANNSHWRIDLHALGVSYKMKRLKQQMLLFDRLTEKEKSVEVRENNENAQSRSKDFISFMSLLNRQVGRYQSLQAKIDELCQRMHASEAGTSVGDCGTSNSKGETKTLTHFLEETFQLQRYMVATGQKLGEIQSKIASGFDLVVEQLEKASSFDMKRFSDNIRTLFLEIQRGLEVRIARIIGDLEGTLACEGMIRMRGGLSSDFRSHGSMGEG